MEILLKDVGRMVHGETRVFDLTRQGRAAQGFIIRYRDAFYAYLNMCSHWPVPMDLGDGDFFAPAVDRIMCKSHGAMYQPETGICEYGPCVHAQLETYSVRLQGNELFVQVPD